MALRARPKLAGLQRPEVGGKEPSQRAMGLKGVGVPVQLRRGAGAAMRDLARSRTAIDGLMGHGRTGDPPIFTRGDAAGGGSPLPAFTENERQVEGHDTLGEFAPR